MTIAKRYQDLVCWQLSVELQQLVYAEIAAVPASKDCKSCDQIRAQSALVTRQIEEGFNEYRPKYFADQLRLVRTSLLGVHNGAAMGFMHGHLSHATAGRMQQLCGRLNTSALQLIRRLEKPGTLGTIYP